MMKEKRVQKLFQIEHPIVQAGMVWCSGWRLASAVSNAGGLGLLGAGSMYPEVLREHIRKCKIETNKPFGVNIPLLYPEIDKLIEIIIEEGIGIVFTSAGNPALWTGYLKERDITVVHVVSSVKFARKAEQAGVDAVVAEGFEAGGHNGREETTTLVLIPMVREAIGVPLIAAGGISSGKSMLACEALGADGVQIGSRFVMSNESSAHIDFKNKIIETGEGETSLTLKQLAPVRLIRNKFFDEVQAAERRGASKDELIALLGKRRARAGIFEGDLENGELEIGQVSAGLTNIQSAGDIVNEIWREYLAAKQALLS